MKRFYRDVSVAEADGGFGVLLDGKALKTPGRATLVLPMRRLAEAVAEEWRGQGETISPATMPLTKLANTAVEHLPLQRAAFLDQVLRYGRADAVCYRTNIPRDLAERQALAWERPVSWLAERYGARLKTGFGTRHIEQPVEAISALDQALAARSNFELAGLHAAAHILGSLALALMLADGELDASQAFEISRIDEEYQAEKWGRDDEAEERADTLEAELESAELFIRLSGRP